WQQAEIDVHRLEGPGIGPGRDMTQERAQRRGRRRRIGNAALALAGDEAPRQQADGGTLHIALDAGNLAGEPQIGPGPETQKSVEQARAVDEGVAMEPAKARELRLLEPRDHVE